MCAVLYFTSHLNQSFYLWELQVELKRSLGVDISISSLCYFIKKHNLSRQKLQLVATQRNEEIRAEFTSDVSIYEPHMLVFIDETGTDRRDASMVIP